MLSSRSRSALTALVGLLALLLAGLVLANPASAADADVRINEFTSNNPDYIELINIGSGTVDLTGWKLKDNTENNSYTFPSGSTIAAGAIRGIKGEGVEFVFGLGNGDSVRLYSAGGTLVDSFDYPAHPAAGKSYSRCPNGTGSFINTANLTSNGAPNDCSTPPAVRINEFSSNNPDFIELINTTNLAVDLSGWVLKDNTDNNSYTFPSGSTIGAGAIKGISGEGVEFVFGLGNGDSVRLYAPGAVLVDSYTYPAHPPAGKSYGRCPDGSGDFVVTTAATKGAANSCAPAIPNVVVNEVESNGDQVADWVELRNNGATAVDISGWKILDNDPAHVPTPVVVPANTVVPAGGYYAIYTEVGQTPGFGLGGNDSATLYLPDGTTQVDTYAWTTHAATTYGRCPDGTGAFVTTTTPTRGLGNACSPIRINEIESDQGVPGDWVELKNIGSAPVDLGGWVFKDNQDSDIYTIPAGTTAAAGGYVLLDVADFLFGLGSSDSARLYDTSNRLIDSYTWTAHAATTYGRCKDGLGDFTTTKAPTKGTANSCPGLETLPWPGSQTVSYADDLNTFVQDLSGLVFDPTDPDVLWAAQNKKGTLYKLVRDANNHWVPAPGWPRDPKFASGTGSPDTEGITVGPDGFVYLTSERDNDASGVSRNTILRFDPNSPVGATIVPTTEWNLTPLLPSVGANLGLEGVTFVPDGYLTGNGFKDQSTGLPYDPATYPLHGSGLFFVAYENDGKVYAFALDNDGTPHKVATIDSGFEHLADITFDPERQRVWAVTDDTHDGKTSLLKVGPNGDFVIDVAYDRPAAAPNLNNEGLAIAPQSRCVNGFKEVLWSDDGDTDGHSLRRGAISCTPLATQDVTFTSNSPSDARYGQTYVPAATGGGSGNPVVITVDPDSADVCSILLGTVRLTGTGTCTLVADQAAAPGYLAGHAEQSFAVAKADQSITFAQPADLVVGGADLPLSAQATSGLGVALTSTTPTVCTVVSGAVRPLNAGPCTLEASQGGSVVYNAAPAVTRTLTVAKAPITVTTRATSTLLSILTLRVTYTTTVTSAVTGQPASGIPVTTRITTTGASASTGCTAVTNAAGVATCTAGPVLIAILSPYVANVAESANYRSGAATGSIPLL